MQLRKQLKISHNLFLYFFYNIKSLVYFKHRIKQACGLRFIGIKEAVQILSYILKKTGLKSEIKISTTVYYN